MPVRVKFPVWFPVCPHTNLAMRSSARSGWILRVSYFRLDDECALLRNLRLWLPDEKLTISCWIAGCCCCKLQIVLQMRSISLGKLYIAMINKPQKEIGKHLIISPSPRWLPIWGASGCGRDDRISFSFI